MLHYGGLLFLFLWTAVGVHSFLVVVLRGQSWFGLVSKTVTGVAVVGLATLLALIALGIGSIQAVPTLPFCFPYGTLSQWPTYYSWIIFCFLLGLISVCTVSFQLIRVGDPSSGWSIRQNIRILAFLTIVAVWAAISIAQRSYLEANLSSWTAAFTVVVSCAFFQPSCPAATSSPNLAWLYVATIIQWWLTLPLALLFGSNVELYTLCSQKSLPWNSTASTVTTSGASSSSTGTSSEGGSTFGTFMSDLQ